MKLLTTLVLLVALNAAGADLPQEIKPVLQEFCLTCHSTEKQKGELDLERFTSIEAITKEPKVWEGVLEQMEHGEMPPKEKPQPSPAQKDQLVAWIKATLDAVALANAGDPGPVVLRRLSNAEYTYTVRDLTGVPSLDPAREFPVDGAAGEGFTNAGAALVMSPSLLTKYLDAAKEIATHAVLLPDGIAFSPATSARDWTEERLAAIRAFYDRFAVPGGGSAVNLQGIKFDTKDGGVLPLEKYIEATLVGRDDVTAGRKKWADVAAERGLNAKYLTTLGEALRDTAPNLVLDPIRAQWRVAPATEAAALAGRIVPWQQALWRFTQVGHIGKRDGPPAWQVPVSPLAAAREVRLKLPAPVAGSSEVVFYLATSDAGDGAANDFAQWQNPRLVAPGRPDLPLRDVRSTVAALEARRHELATTTEACLTAAAEVDGRTPLSELAAKHGADPAVLARWLECLGLLPGDEGIDSYMVDRLEKGGGWDFVNGWGGADALSLVANSSDQLVRIPGELAPHSVAVHPAPKRNVITAWRAAAVGRVTVAGSVRDVHTDCGNGIVWRLEHRHGGLRQTLAEGVSDGGKQIPFGPFADVAVRPGDLLALVVGPRGSEHTCDLTAIDLSLTGGAGEAWNLARDVSPDVLAGNPHADGAGRGGVWHFFSEPEDAGAGALQVPPDSALAQWQRATEPAARARWAAAVQALLAKGASALPAESADGQLARRLLAVGSPLMKDLAPRDGADSTAGLDPTLFGRRLDGAPSEAALLHVQAPSLIEVRLPAELAEGAEFVAGAALEPGAGAEGSVQMTAAPTPPVLGDLAAGRNAVQGGKKTWSDGDAAVASDSPILVVEGSEARRRIEADLEKCRQLFPAALCYRQIVPVDEVVTLTLFYREDAELRRLMLDDAQAAELDRLWAETHYVSQSPFKLVDAYEQLWQFATQDADPSAFEPMREPIKRAADDFRKALAASEPKHVEAVLGVADRAWRRPLTDGEKTGLRALYQRLRDEEMPHDAAVRLTLARVLVAPAFLYRGEKPSPDAKAAPVDDWELATRLSYFLWSTLPDAELRAVAATGTLRQPEVLAAQTKRLLRDARASRLATEFGCQWLHIRDVETLDEKSERHFPTFVALRSAMQEEATRFFADMFQSDGSVMSLLDADHTFVNGPLAKHYGMDVEGDGWRRVDGLRQRGRGGILAFASTLAKQSGASRTSPILRGNWLMEVVLGGKLPKPPKGVPVLPDEAPTGLTERQLIERHSSDPKCASCHERIDPFGFALEGFDAIGRARTQDAAGLPIDTRTQLPDGTALNGLEGLRAYLTGTRREDFLHQFCRKLTGYALGRSVMLSDHPLVDSMVEQLEANGYRVSVAVDMIVQSPQFRNVRGAQAVAEGH